LKLSLFKKIPLLRSSWNNQKHFLRIYYKATLILIIKLKNKIIQIVVIVVAGFLIFFSNGNEIGPDSNNPEKVLYTLRNSYGSIERPLRSSNLTDNVSNHNLNSNSHITVECVIKSDSSRKPRPKKQQIQTLQGLLDQKDKEQSQKPSSPEYMLNESENELLKSFAMKTKEKLAQDKTALEKKCHTEEMNLSKLKVKMILSAVENWKSNHEIEGETITEYFERQIKIIKENDGESRLKNFNLKRELKNFEEKFNIHTLGDISNNGSRKKQIKKTQPEFQIIGILSDDDKLIGFGIKEKLE